MALALFLMCLISPLAFAQQPTQPCQIAITSDFESQCILPEEKDNYYNEEPQTILACQGNTVTYTASANTGSATVTSWTWEVAGGTISASGNIATVTWGDSDHGQITVTVVTDSGTTCSLTQNVKLIEKPTITVASTPAYVEMPNGDKIIYVCKGETVEFTDLSSTTNTDIVGFYWNSGFYNLTASTPNFRIENVWHDDKVIHRVYNNCGCYAEEIYIIQVMSGEILDLGCYGTVCQDAVVTYTANNPVCNQYLWYVDGGTIIDGQGQQKVTVRWDNPQNGYGIIGLDGNLCGNNACPSMLSKKIPIIQKGLTIKGQDIVCVDEAVIYSVPLYGSTQYSWDIQPTTGIYHYEVNGANQEMIKFEQPGTYHISVSYKCEFLECGEFTSDTLTVEVKPRLEIIGKERICVNSTCALSTKPADNVYWEVQNITNNQIIHTYQGANLSYLFTQTGKYMITATNDTYCKPATFVLTVQDTPPAPTAADLDPNNPTRACLGSSILLNANPTNSNYSIVWVPSCNSASPDTIPGNQVTITYDSTEVCDIKVFNYDRILGCLSDSHYVHPVAVYTPLEVNLKDTFYVCPGTQIVFDSTNVPYEEGMTYRWAIQSDKQRCASVQGDSVTSPTVRIIVNEQPTPEEFDITLTRTYCPGTEYVKVIHFIVNGVDTSALTIDCEDVICIGHYMTLTATGCDTGDYYWRIYDDSLTNNPLNYFFGEAGPVDVRFLCNNFDYCTNEHYMSSAVKRVTVRRDPQIESAVYNSSTNRLELIPHYIDVPNYSFNWSYNGTPQNFNHNYLTYQGAGTYTVTITDSYGCSSTYSFHFGSNPGNQCNDIIIAPYPSAPNIDYCNSTISLTATQANDYVNWAVPIGYAHIDSWLDPSLHQSVRFKLEEVGNYVITARCCDHPCYSGRYRFTLDFIPDFWVEKNCTELIIHNNSKYLDGTKRVYIKINSTTINFAVSDTVYHYPVSSGTYTVSLVGFNTNGNISGCPIDVVTIHNTTNFYLNITSPWANKTCDNTAMQLSVSAPTTEIQNVEWLFGDGSSLVTETSYVSHTYKEKTSPYLLHVIVTDTNGCNSDKYYTIHSIKDSLKNGEIFEDPNYEVCPNDPNKYIKFRNGYGVTSPYGYYQWTYPLGTNASYNVYNTGDYNLTLTNVSHCKWQGKKNVKFKNVPPAIITTSGKAFCEGDEITLYGAQSPDTNNYTFQWTVIYNGVDGSQFVPISTNNPNNATNSFTPTNEGTYTIMLSISADGCPSIGTKKIYVNETPVAPTVSFGADSCMHNPPVELNGTSTITSEINWSNGNVGPTAYYFTPGIATAWYYDHSTGCKSLEAKIQIEPEPNFDALLTGCYEKCKDFFETNPRLPVWGLSSGRREIDWKWYLIPDSIDSGTVWYPNYNLSLPLQGFGDYVLGLKYNNGACGAIKSPTLTISPKEMCDCQGLDVTYIYKWRVKDCRLLYDIKVTVCNTTNNRDCLSELEYLFKNDYIRVISTDFVNGTPLAPNGCYTFHIKLEVLQFIPSSTVSFRIYDKCQNCTTDFSIDLMPEKFDCEDKMVLTDLHVIPGMSSNVAAYFDINFNVNPCQNLFAFWSEPPMIVKYWFDNANTMINGLGMVDFATLTQLMEEDSMICFYAITCEGDKLCKRTYCYPAEKIYNHLHGMGLVKSKPADSSNNSEAESSLLNDTDPRLMPNPTTGEVNVIGTTDEIVEVLVLDMNGRQMAEFSNTSNFNISKLSSGIYIVRVKSIHDDANKITFLKLIKK